MNLNDAAIIIDLIKRVEQLEQRLDAVEQPATKTKVRAH